MGNLRVLYDHQIFSEQRYGGISRYFFELMRRLPALGGEACLSLKLSNNTYLRRSGLGAGAVFCGDWKFRGKNRLMNLLNERASRARLRSGDCDIFHPTYFNPYFLAELRGKPFVLTVYDMIHELFPGNFSSPREKLMSSWKRALAERAARIITISETTRKDLVRLYGLDPEKIIPIHLANSLEPGSAERPENFPFQPGFLLFVGERAGYKNFAGMCRGLAPLLAAENIPLVCAGGGDFSPAEEALFRELGIKRITCLRAGDGELAWLYGNAAALVLPSLYEGFGIPVLEAFACRCPAILAGAGSLPEVGGDAALYFDPADAAGLRLAAARVLGDPALREDLRRRGAERLKLFSWDLTAGKTMRVYRALP